ncbi:cyclic nucleotide-binding domain-containing protein [Roseobacteraceae bacterium S113]
MEDIYSDVIRISGLLGVAFYLGAYGALQFGFVRGNSYVYTLLNLIGAALVLIGLAEAFNLASALIQISWILISVVGLTRLYLRTRRLRFSEEELRLLEERMPNLSKLSAKEFFSAGGWTDLPAGEVILRQDAPVGHLFYLASGSVEVTASGQAITQVNNGFLGEINVLDGAPASADVTTLAPSRAFVISREALSKVMMRDDDFRSAIESSLSREMGQRLMQANRRIVGSGRADPA